MLITEFLDKLKQEMPEFVHFCALHMLEKVYDIEEDILSEKEYKTFFTNYDLYQRYLNDFSGVIYNKFDSSIDDVYEKMCHYFSISSDNKSLFEYRVAQILTQDLTRYLSIPDPQMRNGAIYRFENRLNIIRQSDYFQQNKDEAQESIQELENALEELKKEAGIP